MNQSPAERYHYMHPQERDLVLQEHLSAAEKHFEEKTGGKHHFFGVETVSYYLDWMLMLAPEQAKEFLLAAAAVHEIRGDKKAFGAANERMRAAKMALHIELGVISETRKSRHA